MKDPEIDYTECIEWEEHWCPGMHGPKECQVTKHVVMSVADAIKAQKCVNSYNDFRQSDLEALKNFMDRYKARYF